MGWRGLGAIAALLAASVAGGFALAAALQAAPITTGAPQPVVAASPRFPINPPVPLRADPPQPPLATNLPMRKVFVGTDKYRLDFVAPRGWSRGDTSSNEVKFKKPGNPTNTYVMRVEQVISQHQTLPDILAARIKELERDEEQVEITKRGYDTLEFNYVSDGYRRYGILAWLDPRRTGEAEAEVAVSGRKVDLPGMQDLMDRLIASILEG